jgi:L-2-hydroxyglutarate oxidase LhgO
MHAVDCIGIGGGAIGLAIGRRMALAGIETLVLEREAVPGSHASSRNSEVIHSGIYYPPGSIKARLCVQGREQLYRYCADRGIPHQRCGKLIVATATEEQATLRRYLETAASNGVTDLFELTAAEAATLEPELRCVAALLAPSTGIFDSHSYLSALIGDLERYGGTLACRTEVQRACLRRGRHRLEVTQDGAEMELEARLVVNAAGLFADHVSAMLGGESFTIHPCRGEYAELAPSRSHMVNALLYPLPNASGHGLGVHLTRTTRGTVLIGPTVRHQHSRHDYESGRLPLGGFLEPARRLLPELVPGDLRLGGSGIRANLNTPEESFADFLIRRDRINPRIIHAAGINSPGLTSCLAIGRMVAALVGASL